MAVSASRRLSGREIFFDQRRGLGHVNGPGEMIDDRRDDVFPSGSNALKDPRKSKAPREPVHIRWSRSVDIEVGAREVETMDPATGRMRTKNQEFLRRAWFHGDVTIDQGEEHLGAQELAATFGLPFAKDEVADHIQHLNMSGAVNLVRADERIAAERLDVDMTVTAEGRNIPHIVDAVGKVLAKQGKREIRADQMHVAMNVYVPPPTAIIDGKPSPLPKPRLGMESIDASGDVNILDPDQNLKISKAQTLKAKMRAGNQLIHSTIVSPDPKVYAQARFGDTAIHGHHIEIDMDDRSVDVPGPGAAWMLTHEDFGGRKLDKPTAENDVATRCNSAWRKLRRLCRRCAASRRLLHSITTR
jgi:lipopolysaccharide export system protein LptA